MSIEDIKMMGAYMTAHSDDEKEQIAIGHSLLNKVMNSLTGMGDLPGLSPDKKQSFFDLMNGRLDTDEEAPFKRNLVIAAAIQSGRIEDPTGGATDFTNQRVKGSKQIGSLFFYTPQESEVMDSQTKSPKGRKTKKEM